MFEIYPANRSYMENFIFIGQAYVAQHTFTVSAGSTYYLQYTTSAILTHGIQRKISVEGGGPVTIKLIEAPNLTNGNTGIDVVSNLNRLSANTANSIYYSNPSNVSSGTTIEMFLVATGGGPKASTIFGEGLFERIYKQNTDYIVSFANAGVADSLMTYEFVFYESGN